MTDNTTELSFLLKPSPVAGIGVFATHRIGAGTPLLLFADDQYRVIRKETVVEGSLLHTFCRTFAVNVKDEYHCPMSFNQMDVGWHLNHSDTPNAVPDESRNNYIALQDIAEGEEITINYGALSPEEAAELDATLSVPTRI